MKVRTVLSACLLAAAATKAHALAGESGSASSRHIMNFEDVELSALIADVSTVTGYTFVVHPDARTKRVTVSSSTPLSEAQVFDVFLSALRVHGFAVIPAGRSTYRIVPEENAVSEAGVSGGGSNSFTTEIVALKHSSARDVAAMIKPVIDAQGQIIANDASNTIVIVDYASNLPRLRAMLEKIDSDPSVTETISLENIPARELASILTNLISPASDGASRSGFRAIASETGNAVVIQGDEAIVARALKVSRELDATNRSEDTLRVIPLNNANADELVPVLQQMASAMDARRALASDSSGETTIAHHASTNSLVISAPPETLAALERIIGDLDRRRAQVLVEAIIVEMSDDTARELGLQFLVSGTDSTVPFASTNYSKSAPNMLALAGALSSDAPFSGNGDTDASNPFTQAAVNSLLGLTGLTVGVGGQDGDTLFGAILTAVELDTQSRILSKPFNLTLDNGTSSLLVGQEVPVATGEVLGDANTNPFRTVDRKKIGVGLDVTPRISNDDTIRLDIRQEVSSIATAIGDTTPDLIFSTREITTSVIADDGEIIVLGGLVEQFEEATEERVPLLGDIPVAGRLFRTEGKSLGRTNLMVFIRPTIIRDRDDAREATTRSYQYIRAQELWNGEESSSDTLDAFITQVLGSPPPK